MEMAETAVAGGEKRAAKSTATTTEEILLAQVDLMIFSDSV
jgi:hypothetical protein